MRSFAIPNPEGLPRFCFLLVPWLHEYLIPSHICTISASTLGLSRSVWFFCHSHKHPCSPKTTGWLSFKFQNIQNTVYKLNSVRLPLLPMTIQDFITGQCPNATLPSRTPIRLSAQRESSLLTFKAFFRPCPQKGLLKNFSSYAQQKSI